MASHYLRDEIRAAVREEVSRMIGSPSSSGAERETSEGASRSTSSVNPQSDRTSSSSELTLSFEEFYRKREDERQHGFKPPKKKMKRNPSNNSKGTSQKSTNVEIKVGLAAQADGVIKFRRGKTQIITVNSLANKEEIMQKAVAKHASFDQTFDETVTYVLLYPDFREVMHIPGTKDKFTLSAYKQAIGKEFKRLIFYLISLEELDKSDESDSETLEGSASDSHLCKYGFSGACVKGKPTESTGLVVDDNDYGELDRCPWDATELPISGQLTSTEASDVQVLKETFPRNSEEEIVQALESAGSRNEAAEKLLAPELSSKPTDVVFSLDDILSTLYRKVNQQERINVRVNRQDLLWDGIRQLRRKKTLEGLLKVQFFGESGVDTGGLRKEFLSAFVAAVQTNLCEGSTEGRDLSPGPNVEAVENGSFKAVGQVMVMSVLQEGPPPAFLAKWVYKYLCTPDVTNMLLADDDIVNPDIRTLVKRVKEVNSTEELQAIFQEDTNMDVLMNTGFTSTISLEKKDTIIRVITLHNTVMRVKAELDQMREGLKLHGFLRYMEEYPSLMQKLLVPGEDYNVSSTFLMNALIPEHSELGSTKSQQEAAVMAHLNRYVEEKEDSEENGSTDSTVITVTSIFQFLTGKTKRPILPAEKNSFGITVKFIHCSSDHQVCYPTVSTCALWVQLPVAHMTTYSDFKVNMDTAITHGMTFARV